MTSAINLRADALRGTPTQSENLSTVFTSEMAMVSLADQLIPGLGRSSGFYVFWLLCLLYHFVLWLRYQLNPSLFPGLFFEFQFFQPTRHFMRDENNNGSARCFGSREELVSILERGNASDLPDTPRHRSVRRMSSPAVMLSSSKPSSARAQGIPWCNSAIDLLFDFVKCSKMNYVEDGEPEDVAFCSLIQER